MAFIVRYRGRLLLGLSSVVLTNAITLAGPWVLKYADSPALRSDGSSSVPPARIEYDIRNAFYLHLQRLPLAYFHANRTAT